MDQKVVVERSNYGFNKLTQGNLLEQGSGNNYKKPESEYVNKSTS